MRKLLRQFLATVLALAIGQIACFVSADEAAFRQATKLYQQAQWQRAADLFAECANDADLTNHSTAHFYRGECLMQLGDYVAARQHYQVVLEDSSQTSLAERALFRSGEAAWLADDHLAANKLLTQYVEQHPQGSSTTYAQTYLKELAATAQLQLGRSQYDGGNFDAALATFRALQNQSCQVAQQARLAAGWSLWKLERFDQIGQELQPLAGKPRWAVEYRYLTGLTSYAEHDWPAAIEHLTLAVNKSDNNINRDAMIYYLGQSCLRAGQHEAATGWFRQLLDRYPTSKWADDAQWGIARIAQTNQSHDDFQTATNVLREQFPASSITANLPEASKIVVATLEISPADDLLDEAAGLERDGRFDPALAAYHELLEKYPTEPAHQQALKCVARLHAKLAQHATARKLYQEYLTTYPNSKTTAEVLAELAWLEDRLENSAEADKAFTKLHAEFPQTSQAATAAYWLALQRADERKSHEAHRYVDWLIEHHADSTEQPLHSLWEKAVCLKCQLAASDGDWKSILKLLSNAGDQINKEKNRTRTAFWHAEAKFRTGNYKQARIAFEKLILLVAGTDEPWVAMVPLRRAQLSARRQQWAEALKRLDELNQQHPQFELNYEADYLRGRALAGRAEMSAAREAYHLVLANPKANQTETAAMAQWMIGETYFHQYDFARAREVYLKVIDQHTKPEWQARAALQAGKCWELEGEWDKAKELYSTALKRWSGSESEKKLQNRLKWADSQATKRR